MRKPLLALFLLASLSVSAQSGHGPFMANSKATKSVIVPSSNGDPNLAVTTYPNPVINTLQIQFDLSRFQPAGWQLQDLLGNVVMEGEFLTAEKAIKIDLSEQASEIYLLRIYDKGGQVVTRRIVKK